MNRRTVFLVAALACGLVACKGKKKSAERAPADQVVAWIDHPRQGMKAADFVLEVDGAKVPAAEAVAYPDSKQKLVIVVLIQGDEAWMGNETYEEGADQIPGAWSGLPPVINVLAKAGNPGSLATLLTYGGAKPAVRYPLGDASKLTGAVLGTQNEYADAGAPLVAALGEAHRVLATSPEGMRRVLVVIGNGLGAQKNVTPRIKAATTRLEAIGAEAYAIHYSTMVGADAMRGLRNLKHLGYMGVFSAAKRETMELYAKQIALRIKSRYRVRFAGVAPAAPRAKMKVHIGDQFRLYAEPPASLGFEDLPSIDAPAKSKE